MKRTFRLVHVARAKCKKCGDIMESLGGGRFKSCSCGASFIDQERFGADYVRLGGEAEFIEQLCPLTCDNPKHVGNKIITDESLEKERG
jgi:hypothetical protein